MERRAGVAFEATVPGRFAPNKYDVLAAIRKSNAASASAQARARWRYAVVIGVRGPPRSTGSPFRRWCSSTRWDRRRGFLRGNGAVGLDQNPDFAIRQYPEQAKAELSAKVAKSDVLSRPFPREARRAASQTSSQTGVPSTASPPKSRSDTWRPDAVVQFARLMMQPAIPFRTEAASRTDAHLRRHDAPVPNPL